MLCDFGNAHEYIFLMTLIYGMAIEAIRVRAEIHILSLTGLMRAKPIHAPIASYMTSRMTSGGHLRPVRTADNPSRGGCTDAPLPK